jgi:hypothetical protein
MLDRTSNYPRQVLAAAIADRDEAAQNRRNAVAAAKHAKALVAPRD